MGRVVKRDSEIGPPRPKPEPADYSDEVSEEQLKRIRELVRQDIEDEEFEVVDGPAW